MNYNNSATPRTVVALLILLVVVADGKQSGPHRGKSVEDVEVIRVGRQENQWVVNLKVAHHSIKLKPVVGGCRSWIKEGLCQVCDKDGQNCKGTKTCFSTDKQPKISCDSSYCDRGAQFTNKQLGIYGFQAVIYGQAGNNEQSLIPIVFANKLAELKQQSGQFCIFDSQSSFTRGLILLKGKNIQILNAKQNKKQVGDMQSSAFQSSQLKIQSDRIGFDQLQGTTVLLVNSDPIAYKQINYSTKVPFSLQLTLTQIGLSVPTSMLHSLEAGISSTYFPDNQCRITSGKIICKNQLTFGGLTQSMLEFKFPNNFALSLPLHLLIGSCSSRECALLLTSHNRSDAVVVGSVLWEAMALEWDSEEGSIWLHRLNNHWADVYKAYRIDPTRKGFLANLLTLLYHILLYLFYCILGMAALSLVINCLIKWRSVVKFLGGILGRKHREVKQSDQQEFFVGGLLQEPEGRGRKINKLPETLQQDSL